MGYNVQQYQKLLNQTAYARLARHKTPMEVNMYWHIICFTDEDGIIMDIRATESARSLPIYIHLDKCRGLSLTDILDCRMSGIENFDFEGDLYHAVTAENIKGLGKVAIISDIAIRVKIFENILNQLNLGLQIFDRQSRLVFLNETCRRIESLIRENVIGKRLKDIYSVDENYSTILTTIRQRSPVKDRCDTFGNRFGNKVISINSGYPLYLDDRFYGAYGLVMDMEALSDYLQKKEKLQQFLNSSEERAASNYDIIDRHYIFSDIIGDSPGMQKAVDIAGKVAPGEFSVMLLGETGTGKEMFAQSIHSASPRRDRNFVAINCAAIPSTIMESLVFGTVKGAFTGSGNQKGLLDEADGGTLFLDEINSMDFQTQSKLLRVLQEKKFRRVGGLKDIVCNFRIIAAMNEAPVTAINANRLRQDLYYRLNTVTIDIPPLRERIGDIPILVEHYLTSSKSGGKSARQLTDGAMKLLTRYDWPGNVRELFHTLDFASAVADSNILDAGSFPARLTVPEAIPQTDVRQNSLHLGLKEMLDSHEKHLIATALRLQGNNISKAAKALKMSRQALQHRMRKCGISGQEK